MRIKDKDNSTFTSGGLYNLTAQVQENTILNRGLLDLGAVAPQIVMSNNNDERVERGVLSGLYFVSAFMAPFVLLPFFNKIALKNNGIVKDFSNNEKRIIEVSKKYLIKDSQYLQEGILKTAEIIEKEAAKKGQTINVRQDFENVLERFKGKDLRNKLLKSHENVFTYDFLATAWMWCFTPWTTQQITKLRTNRSGFSATYEMIDESQSKKNANKHEHEKKKKLLVSAGIATIPPLVFPKIITKGLKDKSGLLSSIVKKIPEHFNYSKGIFMSKAIFATMWLLCDYPSNLVSARDKYERRDRAIRYLMSLFVFFGGDFVLNNTIGRLSDKYLKTQIMDKTKLKSKDGFFKKLTLSPKNFAELEETANISTKLLKRTKTIGAAMYWVTLVANMAFLGLAMPAILNKMLKKSVNEDLTKQNDIK